MALSKNIFFRGLEVNNVYIKIIGFEGNKKSLNFTIGYFTSKKEVKSMFIENFSCSYNIDGKNPITQAYEYLKTLDEFKDAIDC